MSMPAIGERAPDPVLLDTDGNEVRLSAYWRERGALVVFLRHYG